jgi:hypothetical protein
LGALAAYSSGGVAGAILVLVAPLAAFWLCAAVPKAPETSEYFCLWLGGSGFGCSYS